MNYAAPGLPGSGSLWDIFYRDNPGQAYNRWMTTEGIDQFSPYGSFARSQYGQQFGNYQTDLELGNRPLNFSFLEYLGQNGGKLRDQFNRLSPRQRGENPGMARGPIQWTGF